MQPVLTQGHAEIFAANTSSYKSTERTWGKNKSAIEEQLGKMEILKGALKLGYTKIEVHRAHERGVKVNQTTKSNLVKDLDGYLETYKKLVAFGKKIPDMVAAVKATCEAHDGSIQSTTTTESIRKLAEAERTDLEASFMCAEGMKTYYEQRLYDTGCDLTWLQWASRNYQTVNTMWKAKLTPPSLESGVTEVPIELKKEQEEADNSDGEKELEASRKEGRVEDPNKGLGNSQ